MISVISNEKRRFSMEQEENKMKAEIIQPDIGKLT